MNKNTLLIAGGVVVLAIVLLGKTLFSGSEVPPQEKVVAGTSDEQIVNSEPEVQVSETMKARYTDYSEDGLAQATENNGRAVLFFAALAWCPSCQAADRDFQENFNKVPADVSILKVDYDTAAEMKEKYGIVMQDTFVQVDSQGEVITRWNSGGQGVNALLANIK